MTPSKSTISFFLGIATLILSQAAAADCLGLYQQRVRELSYQGTHGGGIIYLPLGGPIYVGIIDGMRMSAIKAEALIQDSDNIVNWSVSEDELRSKKWRYKTFSKFYDHLSKKTQAKFTRQDVALSIYRLNQADAFCPQGNEYSLHRKTLGFAKVKSMVRDSLK